MSPDTKVAVHVNGRTLTLTNLTKVLYPAAGFTKAEVLDYYQRVAPVLLPHIAGRPLTLKRYPEGVDGEAFFQKHVTEHRPDWIRTARIPSESSRGRGAGPVTYLVVDDLPALVTLPIAGALGATAIARQVRSRRDAQAVQAAPVEEPAATQPEQSAGMGRGIGRLSGR